ncbi:hypothetical protein ABKN59_009580 [Abortiporus biennis]
MVRLLKKKNFFSFHRNNLHVGQPIQEIHYHYHQYQFYFTAGSSPRLYINDPSKGFIVQPERQDRKYAQDNFSHGTPEYKHSQDLDAYSSSQKKPQVAKQDIEHNVASAPKHHHQSSKPAVPDVLYTSHKAEEKRDRDQSKKDRSRHDKHHDHHVHDHHKHHHDHYDHDRHHNHHHNHDRHDYYHDLHDYYHDHHDYHHDRHHSHRREDSGRDHADRHKASSRHRPRITVPQPAIIHRVTDMSPARSGYYERHSRTRRSSPPPDTHRRSHHHGHQQD